MAGEKMLRTARRLNQPLSVVVLHLYDLPELELVFGSRAARDVIAKTMAELRDLSPREGFAVRTTPDTFVLVMPGTVADAALEAVDARLGKPHALEFDIDGEELVLVPDVMVRTVQDAESIEEVYDGLCQDITGARQREARRQKYLRRERESHTSPMGLHSTTPRPSTRNVWEETIPAFYPRLPATIPMPMGAR